jgi:hypothetical protein
MTPFLLWDFIVRKTAKFLTLSALVLSVVSAVGRFLFRHVYKSWLASEAFGLAHILRLKFFNGRPICVLLIVVETNK